MKTNLKLKEVYLLSSEKSTLISSVEHSIDISNFNKEIIENTLIHFKNPNTVENILCTVSNKDEYISFINTLKKYNFFTEILKDPMLDNKITIISYEKYIGKIEYGLRKIGIRNVESIGLEHIDKEINRIKVSDNTTTLLYLPNHPRHAYDLLYNYHNHNIKSIIFGHVELDILLIN